MKPPMLVRFLHPEQGVRIGVQLDEIVYDVTTTIPSLTNWLQNSVARVAEAVAALRESAVASPIQYATDQFAHQPTTDRLSWLPPIEDQDVWASGVTYARSRQARQEEAIDGGDIYARVYQAERPELFFKARGSWVVGPGGQVGIRHDATWNVPEPEVGLVVNPALEIVGIVIGNDMSSRDIEGDNPLYLPQAKVFTASCALGPGILLQPVQSDWPDVSIHLTIRRQGAVLFTGHTHTDQIRRRPDELVEFMGRCLPFPLGGVLLTGTGIVPPDDFTLQAKDEVEIEIDPIGVLINRVKVV